ncbi:hypothetical protein [Spirillospora sp. NPDC029432]|uniref:hypothetical protein n=1 Tax=Spirillospora sp. NPDC029432 TaxID=3154599 RepID=UPI003453D042
MQCPTCGTNTPGTLGTCPNCNAPMGNGSSPGAPLGAPPAIGDQTIVVPPATPAWTIDIPAGAPGGVPDGMPADPPKEPAAQAAAPPAPAGPGDGPSESTAPWAFDPNDDSGAYPEAPPPPAWASGQPAVPPSPSASPQPQPPQPAQALSPEPHPMGSPPPPSETSGPYESIVPESWYARPRKPDAQAERDPGVQQWAPQPTSPGVGAGDIYGQTAVMDSGGYPAGGATRLDQPGMGMGAPMGPMDASLGPPMGPAGPDQGMGHYPPPEGSNKASKPLLIAVSALVAIAVVSVGLVLWPGGDDKPPAAQASPTPSQNTPVAKKEPIGPARQQAVQLNALLNASADTRRELAAALNGTAKCETLPAAIRGFQGVAQRRTNQMRRAKALKVDKLANGARMRVTLYQAFKASLEADQRLLAWANKAKRKCRGKPRPAVSKAPGRIPAERRATIAKKQFVTMWNPVARATGQPQRLWNGL